jgi:hypothetical protein
MTDKDESIYGEGDKFATPELKAMLNYHGRVLISFSQLEGKTHPDLKEYLLETAARIYDLCEKLPVPEPKPH